MLTEALAVIEACRKLRPVPVQSMPGLWRFSCGTRDLTAYIREMGEALESFDRVSGHSEDPFALITKAVRYAQSQGIPVSDMVAAMRDTGAIEETSISHLRPQPGELGPPDPIFDGSLVLDLEPRPGGPEDGPDVADRFEPPVPTKLARSLKPSSNQPVSQPRPVVTGQSAYGKHLAAFAVDPDFNTALADGGDLVQDIGAELDALSDRLEAFVGKVGWTPALRRLAAAWINARNKINASNQTLRPGVKMDAGEMALMLRVSSELSKYEANPELAYEDDPANDMSEPKL